MGALSTPLSAGSPPALHKTAEAPPSALLAARWPTLARAMCRYQENTAESFTRMAYDRVEAGLIRLEDRRELAARAQELEIRPFDAQLLIACAVRQWALDRAFDPTPTRAAPALSPEHRAWRRVWTRIWLVLGTAAALDGIILWKWLG